MSLALSPSSRLKVLAFLALTVAPTTVSAQYGYGSPYGYRRTGWRNIYLAAILIPIAFFLLLWLLWFCIFRAIFRRRRQNNAQALPTSNTNTYPTTSGYPDTSYASNTGAGYTAGSGYGNGNTTSGGAAAGYYNSSSAEPQMSEAYTKAPQAAYYPSGQETYAPPSGAPPSGYGGNGGYAPPSGAPPYGR